MDNIIMRLIELPRRVNAVTVTDDDGDYNIYFNSRLSEHEVKKALRHEIKHITFNHLYDKRTVADDETAASSPKEINTASLKKYTFI